MLASPSPRDDRESTNTGMGEQPRVCSSDARLHALSAPHANSQTESPLTPPVSEPSVVDLFVADRTRAVELFASGRYREIVQTLEPWRDTLSNPSDALLPYGIDFFLCMGAALEKLGLCSEAEIHTGKALAFSARFERSGGSLGIQREVLLLNLGAILNDLENYQGALVALDRALAGARARSPSPLSLLAQIHFQRGMSLSKLPTTGEDPSSHHSAAHAFRACLHLIDEGAVAQRGVETVAASELGALYLSTNKLRYSHGAYARAVQRGEAELGPSSLELLQCRHGLAVTSAFMGKFDLTHAQGDSMVEALSANEPETSESIGLRWGHGLRGIAHGARGERKQAFADLREARRQEICLEGADCHDVLGLAYSCARRSLDFGADQASIQLHATIAMLAEEL